MFFTQLTRAELETKLALLEPSPTDNGVVEMIVCRPAQGERQVLSEARLDLEQGLVGDNWLARGSSRTPDGSARLGAQIAIMNSRIIDLLAQDKARWALAGDQFFIDLDLSAENLPVGQLLAIGTAILVVSDIPHNGCGKFTERYGSVATRFVNSAEGRQARRRGINTQIVQGGIVRVGDRVVKLAGEI